MCRQSTSSALMCHTAGGTIFFCSVEKVLHATDRQNVRRAVGGSDSAGEWLGHAVSVLRAAAGRWVCVCVCLEGICLAALRAMLSAELKNDGMKCGSNYACSC